MICLAHGRQKLPVNTAIVTVEQTGARQGPAAGAHGAQALGLTRLTL